MSDTHSDAWTATCARIDNDFTYHPPSGDMPERFEKLRSAARDLAHLINDLMPASREQSTALTKIEEAVMWANAAIARHG